MVTLIVVTCVSLYLIGLRADRIHAGRAVTEPAEVVLAGKGLRQRTRPVSPAHLSGSVTVPLYRGHSAGYWNWRYRQTSRELRHTRRLLHFRWQPTVSYALRLASAVSGVAYSALWTVSRCESRHNPFAVNGRYKGIFQLHWSPFGLSPYDPIANALSAALTVVHDGSWRQWDCKP